MSEIVQRKKGDMVLLLALASGSTLRAAAHKAGVAEKTAARRLEDSDFRKRLEETRAAMFSRTLGKLAARGRRAIDTLTKLLDSESDSAKLGACRTILEMGNKLRETCEIEQRVTNLESKLGGKKP